jgi:hypothetical protein
MTVWRKDDPPFNIGRPRESHLRRRVYRLEYIVHRKHAFYKELLQAKREIKEEENFNDCVDAIDLM